MSPPAEGSLVKERSRAEVYLMRGGKKLHIPSGYAFSALGFKWGDVVDMPDHSLDGIPTESWPSHSQTPGSVVWTPDAPDLIGRAVWHSLPLPGSRQWTVRGRTVRTRELRGWVSVIAGCNANDPDWGVKLVLDLRWARGEGIDVNAALRAGNVLTSGIHDPGTTVRARCGVPQIEMEIAGWPMRNVNPTPPEPPDWGFFEGAECD